MPIPAGPRSDPRRNPVPARSNANRPKRSLRDLSGKPLSPQNRYCDLLEDITMATVTNALNVPSSPWRRVRRVLRGIGRTLAALVGLLVVLGLVGAVYESVSEAADARA